MKNFGTVIIFGSAVLLAMGAILFITVGNTTNRSSDIRARAAQVKGTKFTAVVSEVDDAAGTITVTAMRFAGQDSGDLGTWVITVPPGTNYGAFGSGTPVVLGIDPPTFDARAHTATALTIAPSKR